jgi:isocitrate/isopropylmalate dehydrogenase
MMKPRAPHRCILGGDGIGPEVRAAAARVLAAASAPPGEAALRALVETAAEGAKQGRLICNFVDSERII